MNLTARTYCPRSGSMPARVIQFFQNNLEQTMTGAELGLKFNTPSTSLFSNLSPAVEAGFLSRSGGVYSAGRDIDLAPDYGKLDEADATIAQARTAPLNAFGVPVTAAAFAKPAKPAAIVKQALPDPSTLQLDDDVPLPTGRRGRVDWDILLNRMGCGQSCQLPRAAHSTLTKAVTAWHKSTSQKFVVSKVSDSAIRVWRTA